MSKRIFPPLSAVIMIILAAAVLTGLCSRTAVMQHRASALSLAVEMAADASEAFYSADGADALAALLGGTAQDGTVTVRSGGLVLKLSLGSSGGLTTAHIDVADAQGGLYALDCEKYGGGA